MVHTRNQRMLLSTATVFVLGNLVSALGPGYNVIMAGRIISAMAHGAFLGIAAVFAADLVAPLFLLFGVGLFIGNTLGGRLADRHGMAAVVGTVGTLALVLFLMTLAIQTQVTAVAGLLIYGVAAFAVVAPLQLRVMSEAGDAPDIASAASISAFTLGSALGIWLGGTAIDSGLGLTSVNWVGGSLSLAGLLLALITWRWLNISAVPLAPATMSRSGPLPWV